jgi:hypothetical protein
MTTLSLIVKLLRLTICAAACHDCIFSVFDDVRENSNLARLQTLVRVGIGYDLVANRVQIMRSRKKSEITSFCSI